MRLIISTLACLLSALPAIAPAQVYQWKDGSGRTVISDTPPPAGTKGARSVGASPPPAEPAAKTTAEKDLEFRKRQQEARERADKEAKEQAAAAQRRDSCERARRHLAGLESAAPVATYDDKGQPRLLETAERLQEAERARQMVAESCR